MIAQLDATVARPEIAWDGLLPILRRLANLLPELEAARPDLVIWDYTSNDLELGSSDFGIRCDDAFTVR